MTPASTFKIPHALAALDAGVLSGPDEVIRYDGRPWPSESYRRDHTLAGALRNSVVWYFQEVADRLGVEREATYLKNFKYGNADSTSNLRSFWLYESLQISPDEQALFLEALYRSSLPVKKDVMATVRNLLIQPLGSVVNAKGEHPFARPWPEGTIVSAKTGSASRAESPDVRWLVGNVTRGERSWIFVSNVVGNDLSLLAAVDLAAQSLKQAGVL